MNDEENDGPLNSDTVKIVLAAAGFFGLSLTDLEISVRIAVGVATVAYILVKTIKLIRSK